MPLSGCLASGGRHWGGLDAIVGLPGLWREALGRTGCHCRAAWPMEGGTGGGLDAIVGLPGLWREALGRTGCHCRAA